MRVLMLATIWVSLACFVAGEAGRTRYRQARVEPRWAWPVWSAGLAICVVHILVAMAVRHGWSHQSAVMETARQTSAVYGLSWGGGVYVNYVFAGIWLAELIWWRRDRVRYIGQPAWMWRAVRAFYFVIVINAAVIFAAPGRRGAGAVVVAALLAAWLWPQSDGD